MTYSKESLTVKDGNRSIVLSAAKITEQGLSDLSVGQIKGLHLARLIVLNAIESRESVEDKRALASLVESLDYALQDAWGFKRNKNFHRWYELPGCSCPIHDNRDRTDTEFQIVNDDCIYHGTKR